MEVGEERGLLAHSKGCPAQFWTCEPKEAIAAADSEISFTNPAQKLNNHKTPLLAVLIDQVQRRPLDQAPTFLDAATLCSNFLLPNKRPPLQHKQSKDEGPSRLARRSLKGDPPVPPPPAPGLGEPPQVSKNSQSWVQGWYIRILPAATRSCFTLGAASSSKDPQSCLEVAGSLWRFLFSSAKL